VTTFFITRHPGAIEWANRQQFKVDIQIPHLDPAQVQAGDTVIGTLPVNLAAQVCAKDAAYWHLSLALPANQRGQELSADELERLGAHIESFQIIATRATP
jgi:CRISPR-associated protein Csx16